jgi:branched-chain amino acid transport system permease protein
MEMALQSLISGLALGCIYAMVALGFVLIYKSTGVINFAQGELMMVGAYIYYSLTNTGLPPVLALIGTVMISGLLGAVIERLVLEKVINEPPMVLVLVTVGLATVLRAITGIIWSHDTFTIPSLIPEGLISIGPASLSHGDLSTISVTALLCLILFLFFRFTRMGVAMRAVAQNQYAAQLMGISSKKIFMHTWALAAAIAAVGGILLAQTTYLHTNMGFIGLKAFPAVVLGGLVSFPGALLGGLIIGLSESFSGSYIGGGAQDIVPYIILLGVLMVRPTGFFGEPEDVRV